MSADLYTSEIASEKHGDLWLEMYSTGLLRIVSISPASEGSACFSLPPTPEGWNEAERIIGALQEWIRHTKELEENFPKEWRDSLNKGLDR